MRRLWWFGLIGLTVLLVACSSEAAPSDGTPVVRMLDNSFDMDVYEIAAGETVRFVNEGRNPHNAIDAGGEWSTEDAFGDLVMLGGDETSLTFDRPATYQFFCSFHSVGGQGMVATLVVGDGAGGPNLQAAGEDATPGPAGARRQVPGDYPNIQAAVDAADPGDLILVDPGVYREQVNVTTADLVIRGTDRNAVVIDGEFQRDHGIFVVSDGVAVENLTVRNAAINGVFWNGVEGFRASYVTAHNLGDYGIYAFDSSDGLIEHSYASGAPDGGYYVGQCDPCRTIITQSISEWNGLGYSGTNASTELYLIDSVWRHNGAGIVPNTLDSELLPPFHDITIVGNLIHDNGNLEAPFKNATWPAVGNGIVLAGGHSALVERNRVVDHPSNGVLVVPNLDANFWFSSDNVIRDNVIEGSGRADLALGGPAGSGNCFEDNHFATSLPVGIELFQGCEGLRLPVRFELAGTTEALGHLAENGLESRPDNPYQEAPVPGPQPNMPDGADAPVRPAIGVYAAHPLDLASLTVPDLPDGVTVDQTKGITVFGILLDTGVWSIYFGLWAYLMPFMLFGALLAIALWDLVRRDDAGPARTLGWIAVVLLVPFLGVIAYFVFGRSAIAAWQRWAIVAGGLVSYLVLFGIGMVVGGIV